MSEELKQEPKKNSGNRVTAASIIRLILFGITGTMSLVIFMFGINLLFIYGFGDLGKSDYLETSSFAEVVCEKFYTLSFCMEQMMGYSSETANSTTESMDSVVTVSYAVDNSVMLPEDSEYPEVEVASPVRMTYEQLLENSSTFVSTQMNNGEMCLLEMDEDYNASWYSSVLLSDYEVRFANSFVVVPRSVYIDLATSMMKPNAVSVDSLNDEELIEVLLAGQYHSELESVNSYLSGKTDVYRSASENGEVVLQSEPQIMQQIIEDVRANDQYLWIDDWFGEDSYIVTLSDKNEAFGVSLGDMTLVYSPNEDKFYSSCYGWYMVPENLYFLSSYPVSRIGNYAMNWEKQPEYSLNKTISGEALFWLPFIDQDSLFRIKIGDYYKDYIQAVMSFHNDQQNFLYYIKQSEPSGGGKPTGDGNVNSPQDIIGLGQYMIITRHADDIEVEQKGINNSFISKMLRRDDVYCLDFLQEDEILYIAVRPDYSYNDDLQMGHERFGIYRQFTVPTFVITALVSIIMVVCIVLSIRKIVRAGRDAELIFVDRIPAEIIWTVVIVFLVALVGIVLIFQVVFDRILYTNQLTETLMSADTWSVISLICGACFVILVVIMIGLMSLIRRLYTKQNYRLLMLARLFAGVGEAMRAIAGQKNLVAQVLELYFAYFVIMGFSLAVMLWGDSGYKMVAFFIFALNNIGMLILAIRKAKGEQAIRKVTKELAEGNLEVNVPSGRPLEVERQILNNIEHLGDGLHKALDQSVYDEKMKAALITNVSHDIKTPLTSIINYVDLMKRENIDNENVLHYIEVLDQKSRRLKQLTEDLVEVSKISSGNIELECMPINLSELVWQSIGEFQDKFDEHKLHIVDDISEEPCVVYADGRRTFRIMDNLMQNVYKYAMPDTRVYIELHRSEDKIRYSIKNISQAALNIDVQELMERFVRGDQSRSTEGSGLGLSIARDLVQMQNGEFDITLDGDLFKVSVTFPVYVPE